MFSKLFWIIALAAIGMLVGVPNAQASGFCPNFFLGHAKTPIIASLPYTIGASDECLTLVFNSAIPGVINIPAPAGSFTPSFYVAIQNIGAGTLTLTPSVPPSAPPGGGTAPTINGNATLAVTTGGNALLASGSDGNWYATTSLGASGMNTTASNAVLPTARDNLGLGTGSSVQFKTLAVGGALPASASASTAWMVGAPTGASPYGGTEHGVFGNLSVWNQGLYGWGCSAAGLSVIATTGATPGLNVCQIDGDNTNPWGPAAHPTAGEDRDAEIVQITSAANTFGGSLAGTFTATTFVPTTPLTAAQVAMLRVGMEVKTNDATPAWGLVSAWATNGTSITVQEWCQQNSGVEACTIVTPAGTAATISPKNGIWGQNVVTTRVSGGEERQSLGNEFDVNNNTGVADTGFDATTYPFDIGVVIQSVGTSEATAGLVVSGTFNWAETLEAYGGTGQLRIVGGPGQAIGIVGTQTGPVLKADGTSNLAANIRVDCNSQIVPVAQNTTYDICTNFGNGPGEIDLFNDQSSSGDGFDFRQVTGAGTTNDLFWVHANGNINIGRSIGSYQINGDTFLTRPGAAHWQLGAADAAAPVTQTLGAQNVVAGTSNTAGADLTIAGSQGTGSGNGGGILLMTAVAGASGTAQNAETTTLSLRPLSATFGIGQSVTVNGNCNGGFPNNQSTTWSICDNKSGGSGEVNFYNDQTNGGGFDWWQETGVGTGTRLAALYNGLQIGSPTGGDRGAGTLNLAAGGIYDNGTAPTGTGGYVHANSPTITTPSFVGAKVTQATKTANYTILATDSGTYFDNTLAPGTVIFTLPPYAAGLRYCFQVTAAQIIEVLAPAATNIAVGTMNSVAAGNIQNGSVYSGVCLVAASVSNQWVADREVGFWAIN